MSQRNDTDSTGFAVALVLTAAALVAMVIFALAAFVTFIFTVLSLCAWNKPLTLGGLTLEPPEARAFVIRGLLGAAILPAFALFSALLFGLEISEDTWFYLVLGGYILGSLGIEFLNLKEDGPAQEVLPPLPVAPAAPPPSPPSNNHPCGHAQCPLYEVTRRYARPGDMPPPRQFHYADWDDEEVRR